MNMMDAVFAAFSQYAEFNDRARRAEYWYFALFNIIVTVVLSRIGAAISGLSFLYGIYNIVVLIPRISVGVRRLHDTGRSGWWLFLNLVPAVGSIILLVWMCQDSGYGSNQYGPNPKY